MKEKKNEEVKVYKERIITKDRIISVVIGIIIGALITSIIFCFCMKAHQPKTFDNQRIQVQDRNRYYKPKDFNKENRPQHKKRSTESSENTKEDSKSSDTTDNN